MRASWRLYKCRSVGIAQPHIVPMEHVTQLFMKPLSLLRSAFAPAFHAFSDRQSAVDMEWNFLAPLSGCRNPFNLIYIYICI